MQPIEDACPVSGPSSPGPRHIKTFVVAEVIEEPDSPPLSDLSAQSSSENVTRDTSIPHKQEASESSAQDNPTPPPPNKRLESVSDTAIGSARMEHSVTPELEYHRVSYPQYVPPGSNPVYAPYRMYPSHHVTVTPQYPMVPNVPIMGHFNSEHYHTTSYLSHAEQHPTLSSGVYVPSPHPQQPMSTGIYTSPHQHHHTRNTSVPSPLLHPPPVDVTALPTVAGQLPSFYNVPQADLLAKAFMTFLHSIGAVFRDPAFEPLLRSLDQHFESKTTAQQCSPPVSSPVSSDPPDLPEKPEAQNTTTVTPLEVTAEPSTDEDMDKQLTE